MAQEVAAAHGRIRADQVAPKPSTLGMAARPSKAAMDKRSFGDAGRYYAANQSEVMRTEQRGRTPLERRFAAFLERHDHELKLRVERGFKQWNNILRDYLRNETGLRLTVGDDAQAVPVRIDDGLPEPFAAVVGDLDQETWSLLLNRAVLHDGMRAASFLRREFHWIDKWLGVEPCPAEYDEVRRVRALLYILLRRLRRPYFVERITAIQEDVLGAYFFRFPEVRLYWMVIGFLSGVLGVPVEALTLVTAAHELAHAYTHLGRDIDGNRWETESFAATNPAITEGLAQFYTKVICKKLEVRFPASLESYERLVKIQSGPYLVHQAWTEGAEGAGEVIRISMITCRSTRITRLGRFEAIRRRHAERLAKGWPQGPDTDGDTVGLRPKPNGGVTPPLSRAVTEAVLWTGQYYYAGGITDHGEWCKIIEADMGPEVIPFLDDAWTRITVRPSEKAGLRT